MRPLLRGHLLYEVRVGRLVTHMIESRYELLRLTLWHKLIEIRVRCPIIEGWFDWRQNWGTNLLARLRLGEREILTVHIESLWLVRLVIVLLWKTSVQSSTENLKLLLLQNILVVPLVEVSSDSALLLLLCINKILLKLRLLASILLRAAMGWQHVLGRWDLLWLREDLWLSFRSSLDRLVRQIRQSLGCRCGLLKFRLGLQSRFRLLFMQSRIYIGIIDCSFLALNDSGLIRRINLFVFRLDWRSRGLKRFSRSKITFWFQGLFIVLNLNQTCFRLGITVSGLNGLVSFMVLILMMSMRCWLFPGHRLHSFPEVFWAWIIWVWGFLFGFRVVHRV